MRKRLSNHFWGSVLPYGTLFITVLCLTVSITFSAISNRSFLPTVYGAPLTPGTITLIETDTTFISATYDTVSKRIVVAYINRAQGNRIHETELINDKLEEIKDPVLTRLLHETISPSFVPVDSSKDAAMSQFILDGWVWLFRSSRDKDNPDGPFKLKLTRFKL